MTNGTSVVEEYGEDSEQLFQNTFKTIDTNNDNLLSKEELYTFYCGLMNEEGEITKKLTAQSNTATVTPLQEVPTPQKDLEKD